MLWEFKEGNLKSYNLVAFAPVPLVDHEELSSMPRWLSSPLVGEPYFAKEQAPTAVATAFPTHVDQRVAEIRSPNGHLADPGSLLARHARLSGGLGFHGLFVSHSDEFWIMPSTISLKITVYYLHDISELR